MLYFSESSVNNAFDNIKGHLENKLFGILGILKAISTDKVTSNKTYRLTDGELAKWLDDVLYMSSFDGSYGTNDIYVKFSTHWQEYIKETFIKSSISIFDLIVFIYKFMPFEKQMSCNELLSIFAKQFHLSQEIINDWFSTINKDLEFVEFLTLPTVNSQKAKFKSAIGISNNTISMDSPYSVVARAGELSRAPFVQTLYAGKDILKCLIIFNENIDEYYGEQDSKDDSLINDIMAVQKIYFGAPGTGKSFDVNKEVGGEKNPNAIRTTFHPDSDYSSFVGCYKPIEKENRKQISLISADDLIEQAKGITGVANQVSFLSEYAESIIPASEAKGLTTNKLIWDSFGWHNETYFVSILTTLLEERAKVDNTEITYEFNPQAFTKAYVAAWKEPTIDFYLVIEEINRGNCAQIFGDIFQLLDRDTKTGESSYAISPDNDLQKYLREEFANADIEDADIKNGTKMKLPRNLSIYATMNTSDQSLFPIDSAFKRRWDWKYVPINKDEEGHYIECGNVHYDWWDFLEKVNPKIDLTTGSEDKQLGFWFAKPENNGRITAEKFVSKVVFYLWNDVFKDYTTDSNNVFKTSNGIIKFRQFFDKNGVSLEVLNSFLEGLGVKTIQTSTTSMDESSETMDEDGNVPTNTTTQKDFSKYSINDQGSYSKGKVVFEAVKLYVENNAAMTNDEIVRTWLDLGINVPNLIETSTIHNSRIQSSSDAKVQEKSKELNIEGRESIYVSNQFNVNRINEFMSRVNATNWGITIKVRIG